VFCLSSLTKKRFLAVDNAMIEAHLPMLEGGAFPPGRRRDLIWAGSDQFYAHDGLEWSRLHYDVRPGVGGPIDGGDGHAGLRMEYDTFLPMTTEAIWTCHAKTVPLGPGFYLIIAEANPFWDDDDDFTFYDYDGFGAIRQIQLRKVAPVPVN
jgi:hypothetical protein